MNPPVSIQAPVDTHFHVFDAHQAVPGSRYVPSYDAPYDHWWAQASAAGVRKGVVVQPSFLGTDNSRLIQELQLHADTLRGVAVVASDAGIDELASLHSPGVRGIRLNLAGKSMTAEPWVPSQRLTDALLALRWHVEVHTDLGALPSVLEKLPRALPLVIDHMGKPDAVRKDDPTVAAVRQRRNTGGAVWVKLSGPYRLHQRDAGALANLWQGELGSSALLWGSDWPFTNHEQAQRYNHLRAQLNNWLPATALQSVLSDNPRRLYWSE